MDEFRQRYISVFFTQAFKKQKGKYISFFQTHNQVFGFLTDRMKLLDGINSLIMNLLFSIWLLLYNDSKPLIPPPQEIGDLVFT